MSEYTIRPLGPETWDAFARLCEKHKGMGFGGCWCTWFHPRRTDLDIEVEAGRPYKELLVRQGRAHAALVFDGDVAVGWCQFGTPEELPSIMHRKDYEAGLVSLPDYRLTWWKGLIFGGVLGAIGQAGDLLESLMKRDAEVKDSGALVPGFGGILDIIDSPLLAAPFAYLMFSLF